MLVVVMVTGWWWRRQTALIIALPVNAISVIAASIVAPLVVACGFDSRERRGRRQGLPVVSWRRPWAAQAALPDGVGSRPVTVVPAKPVEH